MKALVTQYLIATSFIRRCGGFPKPDFRLKHIGSRLLEGAGRFGVSPLLAHSAGAATRLNFPHIKRIMYESQDPGRPKIQATNFQLCTILKFVKNTVSGGGPFMNSFRPGDVVPETGIYSIDHDLHRMVHECTLVAGTLFPLCRKCRAGVRFSLLRAVEGSVPPFVATGLLQPYPQIASAVI